MLTAGRSPRRGLCLDADIDRLGPDPSSGLDPAGVDELMSKASLMPPWTSCGTTPALVLTAGDGIRLTDATAAKGGDATDRLKLWEICWPRTGSSVGHLRVVLLSAAGQTPMAVDSGPGICSVELLAAAAPIVWSV